MGCSCKRRRKEQSLEIENINQKLQKRIEMDDFDEEKAKELVKSLLSSDLKFYKDQLYDVLNLNSKEFRKLFDGDSDYIYTVKNQENFKKLALKFENFSILLNEWYKNGYDYHICLKQLWKNFINLFDLKDLDDEEMEKKLKNTNYKNWNEEIKEEFKIIIRNSNDMSEKFKIFMNIECKPLDSVIKGLKKAEKSIEKTEEKEKKNNFCIKDNINMIINKILETTFPMFLNKKDINNDEKTVDGKEKKKGNEIKLTENKKAQLIKNVAKMYITGEIPKDFNINEALSEITEIVKQFDNIKIIQSIIKEKLNSLIDNKFISYGILGLSYLNLCYNIISTNIFLSNSETKINELKDRLTKIKQKFELHKKEIGYLPPDDIEGGMRKIEEIGLKLEEDKYEIEVLIQDISKEIKNQKSQKNKGFFKIFSNLGMMGFNAVVAINNKNIEYGLSALFNGISIATDTKAIIQIGKNVEKLESLFKEAKEEEKKIKEAIKALDTKYNDYQLKIRPI